MRDVAMILERAAAAGVSWIDTAPDYGDAEALLGGMLASAPSFRLVTKIPSLETAPIGAAGDTLYAAAVQSLERLRQTSVDVLLLHRAADLSRPDWADIVAALQSLRAHGLTRRIGAAVYDPRELDLVITRLSPDVVQLPLNPLDRRFSTTEQCRRLCELGIAVHARSLFLQGLLVAAPDDLPDFARSRPEIAAWRRWLGTRDLPPLTACLSYAMMVPQVEVAFVGIAALGELEEILRVAAELPADLDISNLPNGEPDLIDPRKWPKP